MGRGIKKTVAAFPRGDVLVGEPPPRDVVRVIELIGSRGGVVLVLVFSCGHWKTARKLPSKTTIPCVGCLVEAALTDAPPVKARRSRS